MGRDIEAYRFDRRDFERFRVALENETEWVAKTFDEQKQEQDENKMCCTERMTLGFELELWLVDDNMRPSCFSDELLKRLPEEKALTHELGRFQLEYNSPVFYFDNRHVFADMEKELTRVMNTVRAAAKEICGGDVVAIGTLPALERKHLCKESMTTSNRYRVLTDQWQKSRDGEPAHIHIRGQSGCDEPDPANYFNVALFVAPVMVAIASNASFLFGEELWHKTRIPLFEQGVHYGKDASPPRVFLGHGFVKESPLELFRENLEFSIILPEVLSAEVSKLSHLKLHNGCIWRWCRLMVGNYESTNKLHYRIEFRPLSSGPTIVDTIANAAFFYGLLHFLATSYANISGLVDFNLVQENFYEAAKNGLFARLCWIDLAMYKKQGQNGLSKFQGQNGYNCAKAVSDIVLELLPCVRQGLEQLGVASADIHTYLGIIDHRATCKQSAAVWQQRWVHKHGKNFEKL